MRNWLTFSSISTVIFAVAVAILIKGYRTELTTRFPDLDPRFSPGHTLPPNSYCDWQFAVADTQYCTAELDTEERISMDVNSKTGLITRTNVSSHGMTVGDLMLIWGEPSGYSRSGIVFQVYWQNRSVYITTSALSPHSPVVFISYDLDRPQQLPWSGLVNTR
jgi:hypothetical protein